MGRVVSCSQVKAWVTFYINSLPHSDPQHYVKTKDSCRQTQPSINYPYITCIIKVFENVYYIIKLYMCIYEVYYTLEFPNVFQNPYKKHASTNYILNIFKLLKLGD